MACHERHVGCRKASGPRVHAAPANTCWVGPSGPSSLGMGPPINPVRLSVDAVRITRLPCAMACEPMIISPSEFLPSILEPAPA